MRILAVGAHPDDLEILCAGTLLRYVDAGHEVVMCHVTKGAEGGYADRDAVAETRAAEAQAAARAIGARYETLGVEDGTLCATDADQLRDATELVRRVRPDVVITHDPFDYHDEHIAVSRLIADATFRATIPLARAAGEHLAAAPPVFFMDTVAGLAFEPAEFVDITAVFERKVEALRQHHSQVAYMEEHYGKSILQQLEVTAGYRGFQCGVRYAEAFRPLVRWPRLQTTRLLP